MDEAELDLYLKDSIATILGDN